MPKESTIKATVNIPIEIELTAISLEGCSTEEKRIAFASAAIDILYIKLENGEHIHTEITYCKQDLSIQAI